MPIRFFDSLKFNDPWYRSLKPKHKAIFEFAISTCDCGGIFKIDLDSIAFHVNDKVTAQDLAPFNGRFIKISTDTVFIPNFIRWQYKQINPNLNPHKGAIRCMERAGVDWQTLTVPGAPQEAPDKDLTRPTQEARVKVKEQEKTKPDSFSTFWELYPKQRIGNKDKAFAAFERALHRANISPEEMIAKAKEYSASEEVQKGYAKGAEAWLNDDRFLRDYNAPGGDSLETRRAEGEKLIADIFGGSK